METNPAFSKYMDRYFEFAGQWDSPSKCGLRLVEKKNGTLLAIATEIYRQNPGTPVTEWVAPLATQILKFTGHSPGQFIFIEHTPDLHSKLSFYGETFDLVSFSWDGHQFIGPSWKRLSRQEVDRMMED